MAQWEGLDTVSDGDEEFTSGGRKRTSWGTTPIAVKGALGFVSLLAFIFFIAFLVVSSSTDPENQNNSPVSSKGSLCETKGCLNLAADTLNAMSTDPKADPCEDFFEYSCGGWINNHPIPDDKSRYSTFSQLAEKNNLVLRKILSSDGLSKQLMGDKLKGFYEACLDEAIIDDRGVAPMQSMLDNIALSTVNDNEWSEDDKDTLTTQVANLLALGVNAFYSMGIGADEKDSMVNVLYVSQSGLTLPDPSYYSKSENVDALRTYLTTLFTLSGETEQAARELASVVVTFEGKLANVTVPKEELRDPVKTYNLVNKTQLQAMAPILDWDALFTTLLPPAPSDSTKSSVVSTPSFLLSCSSIVQATPKSTIQAYLRSRLLLSFARHLSEPFRQAGLRYRTKVYGTKSLPSRWKTCVSMVDNMMGFVLGRSFVEETMEGDSRDRALVMIHEIIEDFIKNFPTLDWMDAATRKAAEEKARAITIQVGYPDWIYNDTRIGVEYGGLELAGNDKHFENIVNSRTFDNKKNFDELYKPVDKTKWYMTPPTVNAYYDPSANLIAFPAGILQPPFFSGAWPSAANYGGIGAVIGHEISHGFDDQGRQYDKTGNQRDWWSAAVVDKFKERARCLVNQYSRFHTGSGNVNGNLTLGENIADNGGVQAAMRALLVHRSHATFTSTLPGLDRTPSQTYFIRYAQVWCRNTRPKEELRLLKVDPHSPPGARVNVPLSNNPSFTAAFQCPKGSKMNPEDQCSLW